jgi:outer membrane protein
MYRSRRPLGLAATLCVVGLLASAGFASAADLMDAWRAAQQHDLDYASSRATQQATATRRDQATALWRPMVTLSGTAGVAGAYSATHGAQFTTPGFGTSRDVEFKTSVNTGVLGRAAVSANLPLFNREREAQGRQLALSADSADLQWQEAQQTLMLNTAQRYFDVMLAAESLRVLRQQQAAVDLALKEMKDRFQLGDAPVTDTYEAAARSEAIAAQILAVETDLQLKQAAFIDATGFTPASLTPLRRAQEATRFDAKALDFWLSEAEARNPQVHMQDTAVEVAIQEAAKASAAYSPSVDLVAQAGYERLNGNGEFGNATNTAHNRLIGVQVALPLYTGGMRSARREEALRNIDKARAQAERTRQIVAQHARAAWLGLTVGTRRVAALTQALASSRSRLDATRLGRKVGDRTTLDLLNAENDAANAEFALLQARVELLTNRLRLGAAAGALDEAWLQSVNAELQPDDNP